MNTCSICFNEIKSNKKTLKCEHIFHQECIEKWFYDGKPRCDEYDCYREKSCPICREKQEAFFYNDSYETFDNPKVTVSLVMKLLFERTKNYIRNQSKSLK